MDPNSQIELELVPMASDENLNNIQDDVNANFKQVCTDFWGYSNVDHRFKTMLWFLSKNGFMQTFRMDSKIIKNRDFVLSINILITNQNQTIINDLMVFDPDLNLIQLSNNINQIRWDS